MAKGKAYKKWYRKHYTADGKRKDPKPEFRGGILEALAKGERENNSKLVESVSGLTHAVHGYFIYECEECGAIYKMYLDKGLEDRVQDEQYPEKHKPVPFCIVCRRCKKAFAKHILWGIGNSDEYMELPDGANYFKNDPKEECGKPMIGEPDALNLESLHRQEMYAKFGGLRHG